MQQFLVRQHFLICSLTKGSWTFHCSEGTVVCLSRVGFDEDAKSNTPREGLPGLCPYFPKRHWSSPLRHWALCVVPFVQKPNWFRLRKKAVAVKAVEHQALCTGSSWRRRFVGLRSIWELLEMSVCCAGCCERQGEQRIIVSIPRKDHECQWFYKAQGGDLHTFLASVDACQYDPGLPARMT